MKEYPNGKRYDYIRYQDELLNQPYDYYNNGLLQHLMSPRMVQTKNPITRFIISVFEKEIVTILKVVDVLANFKNPHFKNR